MGKVLDIMASIGEKVWGLVIAGAGIAMVEVGLKIFKNQ